MMILPRSKRRHGATMVETAVVISIALVFMFGIFEYGRFIMTKQILANSAREGARWAIAHSYNGTTANVQDQVDLKLGIATKQLTGYNKTSSITIYAADSAGNIISGVNWYDQPSGSNIAVEINGTYQSKLPNLLLMRSSYALKAKAVMATEGN
jgi:Flp pilus assembly protein TadG